MKNSTTYGQLGQKIRYEAYDLTTGERIYCYDKLKEDIIKFRTGSKFIKHFSSKVPDFSVDVFYKIFVKLMPYLEQNTNRLVRDGKLSTREPLTREDIMGIAQVSQSTLSRFIKECRDKQYCIENTHGIFINPVYATNGDYLCKYTEMIFNIPDYMIEPINTSYIYRLYYNNEIIYVGKTQNLNSRIDQHRKDKNFNSFDYSLCLDSEIAYYINKHKPILNKDSKGIEGLTVELEELIFIKD